MSNRSQNGQICIYLQGSVSSNLLYIKDNIRNIGWQDNCCGFVCLINLVRRHGMVNQINTGDTAWILVCCSLVLLMTPALALFYGGMVRRKNVLSTLTLSYISLWL